MKLGQIADFRNGINYNKSNFGTGIPVISVKDFWERSFPRYDSLEEINPDGVVRPEHLLKNDDILFVRSNGNRELIGRSLFIRSLPTRPVTHSAFTIRVRLTSEAADARFFAYLFRSTVIRQVLSAQGNGANISNLNQDILTRLEVPLPPRLVQDRIASTLSAYDDLIENNMRRIAILEEMARRIYEEWFVRFRFPGHEGVRMVESEWGPVPDGWRVRALSDLVDDIRDGISPHDVTPETPYVGLEHIPRRSIALTEWGHAADVGSTKLQFREGDILFGKIRPYFHKVAVAAVAGVASSDAIVIRAKHPKDFALALAVTTSDAFIAHATQTSNGTKMPRANWSVLRQYPVPSPPKALHERFEEFTKGVVAAIANHVLRNRNLRTTRDLLLPKLISGELDVSALPEPKVLAA